MKRKILLSLFVLMLSCMITLGVVGCDTQACSLVPKDKGTDTTQVFTFGAYTMKNSSSTTDSYSDVMEGIISEGFNAVGDYEIVFTNTNDASQNVTFKKGTNSTWYEVFKSQGGTVTGLNLRKTGMQQITFSYLSYESEPVWVKVQVHGTQDSQHKFEASTDDAKKCKICGGVDDSK